jgi:aspartate racemase
LETRFYGRIDSAEIIPHSGPDLEYVHEAYISMATSGFVTEDQRSVFSAASHRLLGDHGAEAILLGGTDLALAFNEQTAEFPLVDCAGIHADAIAQLAIA